MQKTMKKAFDSTKLYGGKAIEIELANKADDTGEEAFGVASSILREFFNIR